MWPVAGRLTLLGFSCSISNMIAGHASRAGIASLPSASPGSESSQWITVDGLNKNKWLSRAQIAWWSITINIFIELFIKSSYAYADSEPVPDWSHSSKRQIPKEGILLSSVVCSFLPRSFLSIEFLKSNQPALGLWEDSLHTGFGASLCQVNQWAHSCLIETQGRKCACQRRDRHKGDTASTQTHNSEGKTSLIVSSCLHHPIPNPIPLQCV